MDKIKKILIILYFGILTVLLVLELYAKINKYAFSVSHHLYWLLLLFWIYSVVVRKWKSKTSLKIAFVLFLIGAVLNTFMLNDFAEVVLRMSFVGWLVGTTQAFFEIINKHKPVIGGREI